MKSKRAGTIIRAIILILLGATLTFFVGGALLLGIWNLILVDVFGIAAISYWKCCLVALMIYWLKICITPNLNKD